MDSDALLTFLTVHRRGGISHAAKVLHRSQPAISRRIALLEQELGVPLFERIAGRTMLSDAGRVLVPYAERAVAATQDAENAVRALARPNSGPIALAVVGTLAGGRLSAVLRQFAGAYPDRTRGLVLMAGFYCFAENPDLVNFLETVLLNLEDPIDPAFVREFQEGTAALPVDRDQMDIFVAESLKVPARVWREVGAGLLTDGHVGRLESIRAPTLILWGDHDAYALESDQTQLLQAIPGARLETYQGIGHSLHWEVPVRVARDIAAFISEI